MNLELEIQEHFKVLHENKNSIIDGINFVAPLINQALLNGNKILICGNGGSAADAQHIAAEFTGRFVKERIALPCIALTTDTSALTAIGNDYGFERIFARQVEALGKKGDILIGISTSGNSQNVINAFHKAITLDMICISFTGKDGGKISEIENVHNLNIVSNTTARIQEMHILMGHLICSTVDENYGD